MWPFIVPCPIKKLSIMSPSPHALEQEGEKKLVSLSLFMRQGLTQPRLALNS